MAGDMVRGNHSMIRRGAIHNGIKSPLPAALYRIGHRFMKRVVVVGTTGSGKTTFAAALARAIGAPHIELDQLRWSPNWTPKPHDDLFREINAAVSGDLWVIDGNYSRSRPIIWPRADTLVWLDYPFHIVISRLLRRTLRRVLFGEPCCNGNRESLGRALSRDSILLWALQTHAHRRRDFTQAMGDPRHAHLRKLRFRSPKETAAWLERFEQ